jgi:hypothetical protein
MQAIFQKLRPITSTQKDFRIWPNSHSARINLQKIYSVWQQLDSMLLKKSLLIIPNLDRQASMEKAHFKNHILIGMWEIGCQQLNNFTKILIN